MNNPEEVLEIVFTIIIFPSPPEYKSMFQYKIIRLSLCGDTYIFNYKYFKS